MHRLFVALRPPLPIRDQLSVTMDGIGGARWQDDEQLHVTLRFIGEVDRHHGEDIAAALATIMAPGVEARLAGVGCFKQQGRITSLWAGLAPAEPLAALHRKVDHALIRTGLMPESRTYRPHITVARLSRSLGGTPAARDWLATHDPLTSAPFRMEYLTLYESHPGQRGSRYEAIARWPLEGY